MAARGPSVKLESTGCSALPSPPCSRGSADTHGRRATKYLLLWLSSGEGRKQWTCLSACFQVDKPRMNCFCAVVNWLRRPTLSSTAAVRLVSDLAWCLLRTSSTHVQLWWSTSFRILRATRSAGGVPRIWPLCYQRSGLVSTSSRLRTTVQHGRSQHPGYFLCFSTLSFRCSSPANEV